MGFNPGDIVECVEGSRLLAKGMQYTVDAVRAGMVFIREKYEDGSTPIYGEYSWRFKFVRTAAEEAKLRAFERDRIPARKTDPSTSQHAAKPKRTGLRERINQYMCLGTAATGEEIAAALDARLNSVTPRFAELQRAGILKDSGERRNGQIVWVRA